MVPAETQLLMSYPWRTGRRNFRVLYALIGDEPSDDDIMIGSVDAPEIAHLIVLNHNRAMHHTPADSGEGSSGCTCGFGGFHEDGNPNCDRNK